MGARYLTDLADVLAAAGLTVVELDGWEGRARSSGGYDDEPWCVVWHHTASAGNGADDAHYCTFVDGDRPVCNLVIGRDGVVYVCAAGATNCNGKGGPYRLADGRTVDTDTMNLRAIAVELSNGGTGMTYPVAQVDALFAVWVALADAYLGGRVDLAAGHVDWSPGRKIDPARADAVEGAWRPAAINSSGSWAIADMIAEAQLRQGDDMALSDADVERIAAAVWAMQLFGTGRGAAEFLAGAEQNAFDAPAKTWAHPVGGASAGELLARAAT